ncbi:asparagine synthetase B family protein [Chamaesiphon polymorphus]|uniref:asparagine synthase (glutamine-hydrolyzing) n=1 Tax=Chamaesiphon polymorphus CCALA 037 TaxID=2107692 RepID=A0A2T1F9R4_9CYAN|nr:asparagine synthetase B family protein [Chamaesiphon polymorphus]PSB41648.1 asparagine synthase [Chamaesiphon polymorphus CCALA 037]
MGQNFHSGIVIGSAQLVGYWGQIDRSTILASLLPLPVRSLGELPLGCSASGLGLDCWVRLQDENLILGREPFGRMPLYWTECDRVIWFSTHLQLLLPLLDRSTIDVAGFYGYSCCSYIPTPLTPIDNIHAVAAGTEISISLETFRPVTVTKNCWQQSPQQLTDENIAIDRLQGLLQSAVACQIQDLPDAPVGVLLSGGLDSSIVAALLVKNGIKVRAYSLDFDEAGISEYPYAEQVANHLQIPLVKVPVNPKLVRRSLDATVRALDSPYGDGVTVPLYLLCQAASQEVPVIFNGEGGDQLFAGWTNKPLIAASMYGSSPDLIEPYLQTFHRLYGYESRSFQPQILDRIESLSPTNWLGDALDPDRAPELLHRLRRASLMLKGAQNIHPRATNLARWHGLQVRSIFCDLPLAQWTFGVSGTLHLQGACEKYILKRAVEHLLPPEIVWRTKRGMGVPLTAWLFSELWSDLGTWLNPGVLERAGYWQPDIAARLVSGKFGGTIQGRRIGEILWLIIMWERWRIQVLGESPTSKSWRHPFWLPQPLWRSIQSIKSKD